MIFPKIKRAKETRISVLAGYHSVCYTEEVLAERRSRAKWAKALAKELTLTYRGIRQVEEREFVKNVRDELLRVAGEDEK